MPGLGHACPRVQTSPPPRTREGDLPPQGLTHSFPSAPSLIPQLGTGPGTQEGIWWMKEWTGGAGLPVCRGNWDSGSQWPLGSGAGQGSAALKRTLVPVGKLRPARRGPRPEVTEQAPAGSAGEGQRAPGFQCEDTPGGCRVTATFCGAKGFLSPGPCAPEPPPSSGHLLCTRDDPYIRPCWVG